MNVTLHLISLFVLVDKHQNQICGQLLASVGDTNGWGAFRDSQPSIICWFSICGFSQPRRKLLKKFQKVSKTKLEFVAHQ